MDTIFQIEPKRFPFFLGAFVSREPIMVPEGHGIVELSFSFDGGVSKIFVALSNGGARALPAWMRNTRDLFELCGRPANHEEPEPPPKEPTEEGLKRYADGRYEGIACVCAFDCEESCKGECGCDACAHAYGASLETLCSFIHAARDGATDSLPLEKS
jgi:hypothetical protein